MRDPWVIDQLELVYRLLLAVLLGGLIGFERERNNHAAGLRTHIMVCLGSCLLMLLSMYGFAEFADEPNVRLDPARLAAQVITGIGFLGAGAILFRDRAIKGLTTAASVWVCMAVGLAVGAGFYLAAALSAILAIFVLWGLNIVENRLFKHRRECAITLTVLKSNSPRIDLIGKTLADNNAQLVKIRFVEMEMEQAADEGRLQTQQLLLIVHLPKKSSLLALTEQINQLDGVRSVTAE